MAAIKGNKITLTFDGSTITGLREKGITFEGEPIDITDDNSNGWRELLSDPAQRGVNISCSGLTKDLALIGIAMDSDLDKAVIITYVDASAATPATITGSFFFSGLNQTGSYNDAVAYSFELTSSGEVTYTEAT